VVRFRIWLATALAVGAIITGLLRAQVSEEQKSRRDESKSSETSASSPKPKKSPTPKVKGTTSKSAKKDRAPARNATHSDAGGSATSDEAPTAIPRAKLAHERSRSEADVSATPKKSPSPSVERKAGKEKSGGEEKPTVSPAPRETPEPTVSLKSKQHHAPTPKPKTARKKSHENETARKSKKAEKAKLAREAQETPKPQKTPAARADERGASAESSPSPPHAVAVPTPTPAPQPKIVRPLPAGERAQVVIEKSGVEEDQGFEPPPSPPPRRFGFWPWSRQSSSYRYLTRSVIEAIRRAPVKRRRWQFIVVHNSGTRQGNARVFDYYHRHVRRMQNGLAYHFVIGNGTSTGNGQIEVGDRWRRQINGGHVHSDYLNNISLGICLVGDFNRDQPTRAQLESCEELIRYLRERCGKIDKGEIPVRPHREMNPPRWATDCPGDAFPYSWFRRF
jgi:N-acetylmuramoyl-L-alanine amidase-like protein